MTSSDFFRSLGIQTDLFAPVKKPPTVMVYSPAGCGKSTELMVAFQKCAVVKSSATVTRPYYTWMRDLNREVFDRGEHDWKMANSAHAHHPDYRSYAFQAGLVAVQNATGYRALFDEVPVTAAMSNWACLEQLKGSVVAARLSGQPLPFDGLLFDEGTEFVRRIYAEMKLDPRFWSRKKNEVDEWAVMDALELWLVEFCEAFRAAELFLGFACQEAPPMIDENKNSVHYGKQKYKGGPATPFGRLRKTWAHALDICLRITLKAGGSIMPILPGVPPLPTKTDVAIKPIAPPLPGKALLIASAPTQAPTPETAEPTSGIVEVPSIMPAEGLTDAKHWAKRKYWTEAHPDWETKFRDFSISFEEDLGLRSLLERASYL